MTHHEPVTNHTGPRLAGLLVLAVALTACIDDDAPTPVEPLDTPELMQRYVALGNSITAGFQSGGLRLAFQRDAYPVLLAEMADAPFVIPAIATPGCPVPFVAPLSTQRVVENIPDDCAGRALPAPAEINNLAVPGAAVGDLGDPTFTGGGLGTLLLGGRTQLGLMDRMDPTFVSVWIGNNDALGPALAGDTAGLTPLEEFQASFDVVVEAIADTDADAMLIGVVDAALFAPALQPGAYFHAVANMPEPPVPLVVDDNCAFGQPGGFRLVSFLAVQEQLAAGMPAQVNCAYEAPGVLNEDELDGLAERVAAYNAYIEAEADANGWIYVDPVADLIGDAAGDPTRIRKCQDVFTATTAQEFSAAVMSSCPVEFDAETGAPVPDFFGTYISFDAVHPSSLAHEVVADRLAAILNEERDLGLPVN